MTGGPWLTADFDASLDRPRAAGRATRARSPVESHESHPCSRPGAAAKTGWSEGHKEVPFERQGYTHGSRKQGQVASRTKAGSRLLLEPQLRGFRMGPYKGSTRPRGHISCPARRPSTADKKSAPRVPSHRARQAAAAHKPVAGARGAQTRSHGCLTTKTKRLRRQRSLPAARETRPPRPRTAAALDERRESKHTKSREARAVAATSDEDGHQLIQKFAHAQA